MTEPAPAASTPAAPLTESEDKQWASFAHFGNILSFVPALIIWLIFRERGPKTNVEGKEALNWGINVTGAFIILQILNAILAFTIITVFLFGLIIFALLIVNIIFAIMGGVKVNGGGSYRYPANIRWIK
ncbi:MAG: DUF4870 domain-containing protein [Actinomycetota bacterium]|nr:DUF4870 domain-containing protein [Actinomycetota bacterium]